MNHSHTYDCIVMGGGPAGATVSTLLADHGRRVLLLEKARFPRHHIGESLMPETYWTFRRLGLLEKLKGSAFPRKESVQFVSASGKESQPFFFTDRNPHECSVTWQVRRDEFDRMMLDNAGEHGVEVREGVLVRRVLFDGDRAVGVLAGSADGTASGGPTELRAEVIVDATGQSAILSKQLDLRYHDRALRNASIYAYYEGAIRDEGRNEGATIIIHTPDREGWFWFIPLPDGIDSVGLVAPPEVLFGRGRGADGLRGAAGGLGEVAAPTDPLAVLEAHIARCPGMARRLESARRVGEVRVLRDFSYRSRRVAGDGWVLVGDAFGFLDPVYSSGVMLALRSGEMAADAIHAALEAGDVSADRLGVFGAELAHGMQMIRQLVYAFYNPEFSFARFHQEHPEFKDHLVRILIGDVFNDEVAAMFEAMRRLIDLPDPIQLEGSPTRS